MRASTHCGRGSVGHSELAAAASHKAVWWEFASCKPTDALVQMLSTERRRMMNKPGPRALQIKEEVPQYSTADRISKFFHSPIDSAVKL